MWRCVLVRERLVVQEEEVAVTTEAETVTADVVANDGVVAVL